MNSNGLIQTIVSDDFSVRRLITGLKNTSARLLTIRKPDTATTFGPWVSLIEDNLTSTSTVAALSANQGKVLRALIDLNALPIDIGVDKYNDILDIKECGWYRGRFKYLMVNTSNKTLTQDGILHTPTMVLSAVAGGGSSSDYPIMTFDLFVFGDA